MLQKHNLVYTQQYYITIFEHYLIAHHYILD